MTEETTTKQQHTQTGQGETASKQEGASQQGGKGRRQRGKRFTPRSERPRPEFDQKILAIRRVSRVVAGGRRFSFSVILALGDGKGAVGVGVGKAGDTAQAIEKASNDAKKHMIVVPQTKEGSIPHAVSAKYCASHVFIQPSPGRGLVAGSSVRNVLQLAGISNVVAKLTSRSSNRLNNARAAMAALAKVEGAETYENVKRKREQAQQERKKKAGGENAEAANLAQDAGK